MAAANKNSSRVFEHVYLLIHLYGIDPYFPVLILVYVVEGFEEVLCVSDDRDLSMIREFLDPVI